MSDNTTPTGEKFDVKQFNVQFDAFKQKTAAKNLVTDEQTLQQLNSQANLSQTPIYLQSPETIIFNVKQTWFNIIDDISKYGFSFNLFFTTDRMFYVGLTLVFFALVLYALYVLFDFEEEKHEQKIIEKHYFYQNHNMLPKQ
jgi:hypothetical protein